MHDAQVQSTSDPSSSPLGAWVNNHHRVAGHADSAENLMPKHAREILHQHA